MRAGLSELEADDIYASNALFLTNRENALSDKRSVQQSILQACQKMKDAGQLPTVAYHSLAANGMDTADLVARTLLLARDRLLPEFTYLDPRGIGLWDGSPYATTRMALAAMDATEAGPLGLGGRPPANTDGTPNETLADQFIRLRQFFSLQESRTSGENILVIFPDGTGPALASAMIAGLPLGACHVLEYEPGEIRLDVTQKSVQALYNERKDDPAYAAMLEEGQEYLKALRQESSGAKASAFVSRKDQLAEERRLEADQAFARQQQLKQKEAERQREEALAQARLREEKARQERERQRLEKQQQQQRLAKQRQREQQQTDGALATDNSESSGINPLVSVTGVAATAGALFLVSSGNVADNGDESPATTNGEPVKTPPSAAETAVAAASKDDNIVSSAEISSPVASVDAAVNSESKASPVVAKPPSTSSLYAKPLPPFDATKADDKATSTVDKELESLEDAQERFRTTLLYPEAATTPTASSNLPTSSSSSPDEEFLDTLERGKATM